MALTPISQDFQDDLDMWAGASADVTLHDESGLVLTDLVLTPEEVRVMFTALRDHATSKGI